MDRTSIRLCLVLTTIVVGCGDDEEPGGFSGLTAPADIRTDSNGVHHIEGDSVADVFYASGYMQAVDRLFQMDQLRLRALGRRAEFEASRLDDDMLMRRLGFGRMGAANETHMIAEHPESHALVVAWTAGVNARVREVLADDGLRPRGFTAEVLDYDPEEWQVSHAYAVAKLIVFNNANLIENEILATLLRNYAPDLDAAFGFYGPLSDAYILPPEERPSTGDGSTRAAISASAPLPIPLDLGEQVARFRARVAPFRPGASNNWAVSGEHTANGRPIIAGDPHQPLRSPSVFHMQHLRTRDGAFDVAGFGFVGTPAIQLGFNAHIAWTGTTTYPDWMDMWAVRLEADAIQMGGESRPIVRREETFVVRGQDPIVESMMDVPGVGVILPRDLAPLPVTDSSSQRIVLGWTGFEPSDEADAFIQMNRATTLEEFEQAVDTMGTGAFNFIAATRDDITFRSSPATPDRGPVGSFPAPYRVLDGDDPASVWTGGLIPLERLPRSRGGERGWIASANNDPYGFTRDGIIEGDEFYFGVFFDPGSRAWRIEQELERLVAAGPVTLEQTKALQLDVHSVLADEMLPFLFEAIDAVDRDDALEPYRERDDLLAMAEQLRTWDREMTRDSRAALIFEAFAGFASKEVLGDELSVLFGPLAEQSPIYVHKWTVEALRRAPEIVQDGNSLAMMRALNATAAALEEFGADDTWGDRHVLRLTNEFGGAYNRGDFAMDGGNGTVNVAQTSVLSGSSLNERFITRGGAIYRMVAEFGEDGRPNVEFAFVGGNGGDPDEPHWDDLMEDWRNGVYRQMYFEEADIAANTVSERRLLN